MIALLATGALALQIHMAARGGVSKRPRGGRGGGGRGRASGGNSAAARGVWQYEDTSWTDKAKPEKTRAATGGRSRASKREALYDELREYAERFSPLLWAEWKAEQAALREQLLSWEPRRLAREGLLLQRLEAQRIDDLYGEPVLLLRPAAPPGTSPRLPQHRFGEGDMVALSEGDAPVLPAALLDDDSADGGAGGADGGGEWPVEGVVLQHTAGNIKVVCRALPEALAGRGRRRGPELCLTRHASATPFERSQHALASVAAAALPTADASLCEELRRLVVGSLRAAPKDAAAAAALAEAAAQPPRFVSRLRQASGGRRRGAAARWLNDNATALDASQLEAVRAALGRRVALVQGPPGTGKTRAAAALLGASAATHAELGEGGGVLAVAASNVAADELLEAARARGVDAIRLGAPAVVRESLRGATVDARVAQVPSVMAARDALAAAQNGANPAAVAAAFDAAQREERAAARRILLRSAVVVTTCIGAGRLRQLLAAPPSAGKGGGDGALGGAAARFRTVLIDEATQSVEPASLVPLLYGCEQLVLVGDQKQLPPTVTSRDAEKGGLALSLFDRLQAAGVAPLLLRRQYRMHPALAEVVSRQSYDGKVTSAVEAADRPPPAGVRWPSAACPVLFENVVGPEAARDEATGSIANRREAAAAVEAVRAVLAAGELGAADVGVIAMYAAQVRLIQTALGRLPAALGAAAVEVSSVDGFQGREKELIVISTVRSNPDGELGFVRDARRMNVAISRARRGLVVCGDAATLGADPGWRRYLQWLRRKRCVVGEAES